MILRARRVLALWIPATLFVVNAAAAQPVRIGIPERDNLQYLSFWIAQGAGLFKAEGLDVEVVIADVPNQSGMILMQGRVDVALLQPPVYLGLIAEQHPFVLFASLLANEPINLIVRADVAARLRLDPRAPLADRLKAIKGLKIGVAPGTSDDAGLHEGARCGFRRGIVCRTATNRERRAARPARAVTASPTM